MGPDRSRLWVIKMVICGKVDNKGTIMDAMLHHAALIFIDCLFSWRFRIHVRTKHAYKDVYKTILSTSVCQAISILTRY